MPQDYQYTHVDLPDYFEHQIRDFIRIHWYDMLTSDIHARSLPDEFKPVHFIVGDAPAMYSHAAAVSRSITLNGVDLACGGLSAVMTYPAFRGKGYGNHLAQLSTEYVKKQPFDLGLLWTDPQNDHFYARYGWQHHENLTCKKGEKESPQVHGLYSMLLILSEKAHQAIKPSENNIIFIGPRAW